MAPGKKKMCDSTRNIKLGTMPTAKQLAEGVQEPHDHDVLSGRGNFVNYHAGNEHFRALVRKHKVEYVKCPKPQKGKFSRIIVEEVKSRVPPGRFLKQDAATKLWYDIGEKKAMDKTRQALREGAPDLMKELSGDSGDDEDDDEGVIARKKNTNNSNSFHMPGGTSGGIFTGDSLSNPFLSSMSSPVMSRSGLNMSSMSIGMSPAIMSPGYLTSGMMMTPDMQLSAQQMRGSSRSFRSPIADAIPPPQVHAPTMNVPQSTSPPHSQTSMQQQPELTPQQQQQLMMNAAMAGNNFGTGMLSQQQQQQLMNQQRINQQQAQQLQAQQQHIQLQQLQQQQLQQRHQMHQRQQQQLLQQQQAQQLQQSSHHEVLNQQQRQSATELQMLQNKLAAIYATDTFDPTPIADAAPSLASKSTGASGGGRTTGSDENPSQRVEIPAGNNPRRMPPPSLLKRDDSLRMEKIFEPDTPAGAGPKKKYEGGNGSSAHLSAMSLSMGDLNDEGNLSQVFNSSLRISGGVGVNSKEPIHGSSNMTFNSLTPRTKEKHQSSLIMKQSKLPLSNWDVSKSTDKSSNNLSWEPGQFDMSVATMGASETNNMSFATFGGNDISLPDGNISFSRVFEDPDKFG